jgi:uncharacterized protein (TIGR02145 family)
MAKFNISKSNRRSGAGKIPGIIIPLAFLCGTLFLHSCVEDPTIPILTTNPGTDVTVNSVKLGGEITDDGGSPVTARGICWGLSANPSFEGWHTTDGEGSGIFSTIITDLNPNTVYHARAYAENSVGIAYGNEITFTTSIASPAVITIDITDIKANTAISGGKITFDGGSAITAKGICWSTSPAPDLSDSFTANGTDTSRYHSTMNGLIPATKYFVRAYAKNSAYTSYGEELTFITKVADVDGNLYTTVTIGSQVWMGENLKTTKLKDNTEIPNITDATEWINLSAPAYCWLDNDIQYKAAYGALYNWYTVNTGKLCPAGWHVPTDNDFKVLELALGMASDQVDLTDWRGTNQGAQIKSITGWAVGENGTNTSGFSGLPGGYRWAMNGAFNGKEMITYWWSSDFTTDYGWYRRVDGTNNGIFRGATSKEGGKYVRCLKD